MDKWQPFPEQCDFCGSDSEILTSADAANGWGYDGDDLRCTNPKCQATGQWSVYDDDDAYARWD